MLNPAKYSIQHFLESHGDHLHICPSYHHITPFAYKHYLVPPMLYINAHSLDDGVLVHTYELHLTEPIFIKQIKLITVIILIERKMMYNSFLKIAYLYISYTHTIKISKNIKLFIKLKKMAIIWLSFIYLQ